MPKDRQPHTDLAFRFIQQGVKAYFGFASPDDIRGVLPPAPEVRRVLRQVMYHSVQGIVLSQLDRLPPEQLPADLHEGLTEITRLSKMRNYFLAGELVRLQGLINDAGIPLLSFKGPTMAQRAYQNMAHRPFTDLDLLIRPDTLGATLEILQQEGYQPFTRLAEMSDARKRWYIWQNGQYPLRKGLNVFNIDLHTALMPSLYAYQPDFDQLLERQQWVTLSQGKVSGLSGEDLVLLLCFHGEKNRWETIKYACDLMAVLKAHDDLDWDYIFAQAEIHSAQRILSLGLQMVHAVIGWKIPDSVAQRTVQLPDIASLAVNAVKHMNMPDVSRVLSFGERLQLHLKMQPTLATKARYCGVALMRRMMSLDW